MLKLFVLFLSLFSANGFQIIGADPKTWSPKQNDTRCEMCKLTIDTFIKTNENEIISYVCKNNQICEDLGKDAFEKLLKDTDTICIDMKMCKKKSWSLFL